MIDAGEKLNDVKDKITEEVIKLVERQRVDGND